MKREIAPTSALTDARAEIDIEWRIQTVTITSNPWRSRDSSTPIIRPKTKEKNAIIASLFQMNEDCCRYFHPIDVKSPHSRSSSMSGQKNLVRGSGLLGLRVAVVRDGDAWFAQGLDVDYFTQGATTKDAETNFLEGLRTMIKLHKAQFGHLRFVVPPPVSVSKEYAGLHFKRIEKQPLYAKPPPDVPYQTVQFLVAE